MNLVIHSEMTETIRLLAVAWRNVTPVECSTNRGLFTDLNQHIICFPLLNLTIGDYEDMLCQLQQK